MNNISMYSDKELEEMLGDIESDLAERKESFRGDAPHDVRAAVCAFANDLPDHRHSGVVFIGAKNNGSPSCVPITDELLLQLADIKTDGNIVPPPSLTIAKRRLLGADMAVITVTPSDSPPVRYKGNIYIRIGPRRGIASAQDERILNEKRRYRDRPFDAQPVFSADLSDLDRRFFEEVYLPAAFAPDVIAANNRSYEQRLASTKMVVGADSPTPTVLGVLALSSHAQDLIPGAYIQFLRIAGQSLGDPIIDALEIAGTLQEILQSIDSKMISHNRIAIDLSGPVERRTQPYPPIALQQFVRNAVLHRTYEATNAPVRVHWYDDRIEIINPGGPFGVVTPENFGQPGITDYRNPNLAEALRVLGYVQRYGVGIQLARKELAANGNPPPKFDVQPTYIGVTVRAAP